jgi:C4-dicarboxylate-specific signal transduction histidine kinase
VGRFVWSCACGIETPTLWLEWPNLTKPDGVGLGLTIAGEITSEYYAGRLELIDGGPLPGATFRITLRKRV